LNIVSLRYIACPWIQGEPASYLEARRVTSRVYSTALKDLLGLSGSQAGISSLRLNYRLPGDFDQCVHDVLVGVNFLKQSGVDNIALVGHSFGGAVVIMAATMSSEVKAVVGLSSQTYGTHRVGELSPKPLLMIHGDRDRNLPVRSSWHIFERAKEPKEIVIYKGSGHFLRECHQELYELLRSWLIDKLKTKIQDICPD
jgi:pimeloyl-ACP methyl ester carboxylesterase